MANTRSAKKQARQSVKRQKVNLARKTAIKSAIKKVLSAIEQGDADVTALLKAAESKLARAKGKNTIHAKTAARKVSRLAKKANAKAKAK